MVEHSQGMALLPTDDEGMVQMALRNPQCALQVLNLADNRLQSKAGELLVKNFYRHPGTALYLTMVSGFDSYMPFLEEAIASSGCKQIEGIVLTHAHPDHIGGVKQVRSHFGEELFGRQRDWGVLTPFPFGLRRELGLLRACLF